MRARIVAMLIALGLTLSACGACVSATQQRAAVTIAGCQVEARACKADGGTRCIGEVYEPCMRDGGFRD